MLSEYKQGNLNESEGVRVMRMNRMYMPTLREVQSDAELPSHQLLLRAGMIRKLVAGVYSYLPLGYRVFKKVEQIVREEMDNIDGQEVLMSAIQPKELWEESGRWAKFGPEMFRLQDRHGRDFCLGPTHEEIFTDLVKNEVKSYKQLPLNLYQIQTKYRDEKRPRFGLIRAREFTMKDAYTFDKDEAGMVESYELMWEAYEKAFKRCGLKFKVVQGDAGAMGDGVSHEFIALSEYGESFIAYCDGCDFAATDETAEVVYEVTEKEEKPMEKVSTPDIKTIESLEEFFNCGGDAFVKTLLFRADKEIVAVMVPGDRELNEIKLINAIGCAEHELEIATEEEVKAATKADVGFAGPIGLAEGVRLIVDARVAKMKNMIVGANETDYHLTNVAYGRDFEGEIADDLLMVVEGDTCPTCGKALMMDKGIEVGNIFQLQLKYSKALNLQYLDENGKSQFVWMGSHGIGISRTMAAIIEQYYDESGIKWPLAVAPYHVVITVVDAKKADQMELGEKLYKDLKKRGVEVVLDDRKERAGVKFNDAELIGFPLRVTVGRDAKEGQVEFIVRDTGSKEKIEADKAVESVLNYFEEVGFEL